MSIRHLFALSIVFTVLIACETNDVAPPPNLGPNVQLSLSGQIISENGGAAELIATLSQSSTEDVIINLKLTGTAMKGTDYNISAEQLIISAGDIKNQVSITAIDNSDSTGNKTVVIDIASVTNGANDGLQEQTLIIEDDDVPQMGSLLINEVLYDPPSGNDGDANGDGNRDPLEDEFLEFINLSASPLDVSGFKIYDADALAASTPRHVFPAGSIIPPGKAMVVFGGGTPTGSFGGAVVQTASSGELNMTNAGDLMTVTDGSGSIEVTFDIEPLSNNPNESYTRNPDITGEFEQHNDNTPLLFSPGTKINSTPF